MYDPSELRTFLSPYPTAVRAAMLEGRRFLRDLLSPVTELHFDATAAVCAGFAYTDKTRDVFVNLAAFAKHVTLVFGHGVGLDDPEKRLKGEGAQVRHIRLTDGMATLQDPYVVRLIQQAAATAKGASEPFVPSVVVKIYAGPKRRPSAS